MRSLGNPGLFESNLGFLAGPFNSTTVSECYGEVMPNSSGANGTFRMLLVHREPVERCPKNNVALVKSP
jgi:hypothetical protein